MFGITQPINGMAVNISSLAMAKTPNGPVPEELLLLRVALATNLRAHIAANPKVKGMAETTAAIEISRLTGVGKNTVLRALGKGAVDDEERGDLRLDTLVKLANFFEVSAQDLLRDHASKLAASTRKSFMKNDKINNKASSEGKDTETVLASLQRHRRS